ncbi:oxidoreductase [Clostridia bacterium]|nr:oxidoreductase [Clostridia bacterium]
MKPLQLLPNFYWTGSLDPELRVFDIIMETEFGTTYNSYVLRGTEKTVLFETSKAKYADEYINEVSQIVGIENIDYIVVNHTEPDHSGTVERLLELNPSIKIIGTAGAINFLKEITNKDFSAVPVKTGDKLEIGGYTLNFIAVPNLHWPDSMFTYVPEIETLVTCDMFGSHYSSEKITNEEIENPEGYLRALRYYFDNIFGPFTKDVLFAVKKIEDLQIKLIAPGHGPVLTKNPREIVDTYAKWAEPAPKREKKLVSIPYVSAYGYTRTLSEKITEGIRAAGDIDVESYDLVTADISKVYASLGAADGILFGTPTIVGEALKPIWDLTTSIFAKTHGGKIASAFGSYGWSGEGVPHIVERLRQLKFQVLGEGLRIRFKPSEANLQEAYEFGYNFGHSVLAGEIVIKKPEVSKNAPLRRFKCLICGEIVESADFPDICPVCGVGKEQFVEIAQEDASAQKPTDETFIIVGGGAAGLSAAEAIRKRNSTAKIEIISREDYAPYNRPQLTKGILSDIVSINLYIKPCDWYSQNNITLTLGVEVTGIDAAQKEITTDKGETKKYSKLIFAAGAECFVPPIEGADGANVFTIRSLSDVSKVRDRLHKAQNVAIIGGGVLGLEAAWEIKKSKKNVSIIEGGEWLLRRALDGTGGAILTKKAAAAGIAVFANALVLKITEDGVRLKDGAFVPADLVVVSTGISPNTALAKAAGANAGRSISVDEYMRTSVPDIYAAGDCAAYQGRNYGIWQQAVEMGKAAGANAAGDKVVYEPTTPAISFAGLGTSLFSIGDNGGDSSKKYKSAEIRDDSKNLYEKTYFVNNRFSGGVLIGDTARAAKFIEAYTEGKSFEDTTK